MSEKNDKRPLERIAERLEMLGDELRVRAHLAGLDARDAWDRAHFERITDDLATVLGDAKLQLHLGGLDAKTAWDRLSERVFELRNTAGVNADDALRETGRALGDFVRALAGDHEARSEENRERR